MKLAQCLNVADIAVLRRIATHYDFACSKHSKMELIQEIQFQFRTPSFLQNHVATWKQFSSPAFLRLALETRQTFSTEDITALFHCTTKDRPIEEAQQEGWLFRLTLQDGRLGYVIPAEVQSVMREVVVGQFAEGMVTVDDGPLVYQDESHAMGRDLEVLMDYVRHHEVRLTNEGAMYKRNLLQVLQLLEIPEETPNESWRFGYGRRFHDYPDRLALLYDFAFNRQFVEESADGWLRVTDKAVEWASTSPLDRAKQLLRFYINVYRRPIPRLPLVIQLMAAVSAKWISSDSMLQVLKEVISDYYYDSREQVWSVRILKMLTHLGMIRCGEDEQGAGWFQITKLGQQLITPDSVTESLGDAGEAHRVLIVQPNFDIIVTADQPMITKELACFADLHQAGMVRVYQLSERSMMRGLQAGKSGEEWLAFLHRHAHTTLPGNVERTISDWNRKYEGAPPLAEVE